MSLRKRPLATGIAAFLFSGYVSALGLGEIRLNSALNEPLDAEIPLINLGELSDSEIIAGLAPLKDFNNAGVDKELILSTLVFTLDLDAPDGALLRVQSKIPIREPYLDFLVDVQWPAGRLLREYTLLLDLPVYAGGTTTSKKVEQPAVQQPVRNTASDRRSFPSASHTQSSSSAGESVATNVIAGNQEYTVREGDTLWGIASRFRASASIYNKMEAIHQINPGAFIDGDINLLKKDSVLRLPDYGEMESMASTASGAAGSVSGASPQLSSSGRQTQKPGESSSEYGRLSLDTEAESTSGQSALGSGGQGSSRLRGEIDSIQEELDRSRRENTELKQRLLSLEEQLSTMQRLMELDDPDLRAAQLVAQTDKEDLVDDGLVSESAEPVAGVESIGQEDTAQDQENIALSPNLALFPTANVTRETVGDNGEPVADSSEAESVVVEEDTTVEDSAETVTSDSQETGNVAEAEAEKPAPAASPMKMDLKSEEGWMDKVNSFVLVLVGLVVLVVGAIVLRRKKDQEDTAEPPAEGYTPPPSPVREYTREEPKREPAPEPTAKREAKPAVKPEPVVTSIDDIELDKEDDLFAEAEQVTEELEIDSPSEDTDTESQPIDDMELDLSEFELDQDEESETQVESASASSELNLDEEFDFLGDIDEGDTQLELAQAYIEMGDQAGAREILLEVSESGNDEQKEKARQLMEQLG